MATKLCTHLGLMITLFRNRYYILFLVIISNSLSASIIIPGWMDGVENTFGGGTHIKKVDIHAMK